MSDDLDPQTALRESFAGVHMDLPLDETIRRGRQLRVRRRRAGIAAIACAAAVAGGALTAGLVPGGARPNSTSGLASGGQLAAYTVTKGPHDTVIVRIWQLGNPAGLQRVLRADGVPAHVAFQGGTLSDDPPLPRSCQNVNMSTVANVELQGKIIGQNQMPSRGSPGDRLEMVTLTINVAAIPKNIGLNLTVQLYANSSGWSLGLVQRTPQCTGS
jgi:hypothetical protein